MRRCHDCNSRYLQLGSSQVHVKDLSRISERFLVVFTMAIATALIVAAIVWFSHSQSATPSDVGLSAAPPPRADAHCEAGLMSVQLGEPSPVARSLRVSERL
jgi:hypothetical protein